MKSFEFTIVANDLKSTNDSLMRLWSSFLLETKIGWFYGPFKSNNIINVGNVSIHGYGNYNVKFRTKNRKVISSVIFEKQNNDLFSQNEIEFFKKVDTKRHEIEKQEFSVALQFDIDSFFGVKYIYPFSNDKIVIYSIEDKQFIEFDFYAYSKEQLYDEVIVVAEKILSFLSTQTNSLVNLNKVHILKEKTVLNKDIELKTQPNPHWMDEYPIEDSHFILPDYAIKLICSAISLEDDLPKQIFKSFHHFTTGLELNNTGMQKEIVTTYLMSSIEVLTELNDFATKNCETCSQPIYSIRKRVLSLVSDTLGKHMVKSFDRYYIERSKYIHSGIRKIRKNTGISLPMISENSHSGCEDYRLNFDINLIERVGYIIRKKTRLIFET